MNLIDSYSKPGVIDCYTFVFDEHNPRTGYYTMLATDETGGMFSQWRKERTTRTEPMNILASVCYFSI
jgi:hypothetical protein